MKQIVVLSLVGLLAVACGPVVARVQPARPIALEAPKPWAVDDADLDLSAALERRGQALQGAAPVAFDAGRVWQREDGGQIETLAGPGAWLFATDTGRFWVFESGAVHQAAD